MRCGLHGPRIACASERSSTGWESAFRGRRKSRSLTSSRGRCPEAGSLLPFASHCHLARTSFMSPAPPHIKSPGPVLQTDKGPLRGSRAVTNLKHALCIESYEYFTILMKVLYINTLHIFCSTHSLICARVCYSASQFIKV